MVNTHNVARIVGILGLLVSTSSHSANGRRLTTVSDVSLHTQEIPQSAGKNDSKTLFDHGLKLETGRGVARNVAEAVSLYRKAAALGNTDAILRLGIIYQGGMLVPRDVREAGAWFRKAAELGNSAGMFYLGVLYWSGRGVDRDLVEAYKWLDLAAMYAPREGQSNFAVTRDSLARVLSPQLIAEAKIRGQEWQMVFNARKNSR